MKNNLIEVDCPICDNNKDFTSWFEVQGLPLVECSNDKLVMFRPNVSTKDHNSFLDENYWVAPAFEEAIKKGEYNFKIYKQLLNERHFIKGYPDYFEGEHLRAKESWGRRCMGFFNMYSSGNLLKSVVDIGCATGHMLKDFVDIGGYEKALGIDVSPIAITKGRKLLSNYINVRKLDLFIGECWEFTPQFLFDCFIFWDSLEHIQYPNKALQWVLDNSSEKALIIVHTPDVNINTGPKWYLWSPLQHCFFYSEGTLNLLMQKYEFKFVAKKVSPEPGEMLHIYQRES